MVDNNQKKNNRTFVANQREPSIKSGKKSHKSQRRNKEKEKVNIIFQSAIGDQNKNKKLKIPVNIPIAKIKEKIAKFFDLSPDDFELSHMGKQLSARKNLSQHKVKNESTVTLQTPAKIAHGKLIKNKQKSSRIVSKPQKSKESKDEKYSGQKIKVIIQSTIGPDMKEIKLKVPADASIGLIIDKITENYGLKPSEYTLTHVGRTFEKDTNLNDYHVKNNDTITIVPNSTAGAI